MIYGYARGSTDGQSVAAQVATLTAGGAGKVFREVANGAKTTARSFAVCLNSKQWGAMRSALHYRTSPKKVVQCQAALHPTAC